MTAVSRAADAPRAASSISSSSIRWCCTGGTSGCTMNTSASRQFASSCTPRQSLLNVDVVEGLTGIFKRLQIARASWACALPLKMTILFMQGEHHRRFLVHSLGLLQQVGFNSPDVSRVDAGLSGNSHKRPAALDLLPLRQP